MVKKEQHIDTKTFHFDWSFDPKEKTALVHFRGRMDIFAMGLVWSELFDFIKKNQITVLTIDLSEVNYCDTAGVGLLERLRLAENEALFQLILIGDDRLPQRIRREIQMMLEKDQASEELSNFDVRLGITQLGEWFLRCLNNFQVRVVFFGELFITGFKAIRQFRKSFRWRDILYIAQQAGIDGLLIVVLISFLMGLIMAFQAAIPMRQFGADVYVANLVGLSILRVLGPLMTAVILAGRTGSAFAAELGTMKVNEEISALVTMGLNPIKFLVINRMLAVIIIMPFLVIFADFAGCLGGGVVMRSFGYPWITYLNQILESVRLKDFISGLFKSLVFAGIIGSVGCYFGLQAQSGAKAVGTAATQAVVSSLIWIIIAEGVFAVAFYVLGI